MTIVRCNFARLLHAGTKLIIAQIPTLREEARLRYLADSTAYRREKYSCNCQVDGHGLFLVSPLCFVHSNPVDLNPEYRDIDPPTSFIEEHFGVNVIARCFDSSEYQSKRQ